MPEAPSRLLATCSRACPPAVERVHADHEGLLQSKYAVLTKADMQRRQKEAIEAVTSILGISDDDAARILRKYKW